MECGKWYKLFRDARISDNGHLIHLCHLSYIVNYYQVYRIESYDGLKTASEMVWGWCGF